MNFLTIIGIAFGLAMDAFAVAIAVGSRLKRPGFRQFFRLSFHFGLFQFIMPIIGWFAGNQVARFIHDWDHWIAFGLLLFVGGKMILESRRKGEHNIRLADPTRKWSLIILSIATSIDALAVGLSISMLNMAILNASIVIGIVASMMTAIGMFFGRGLGVRFGRKMELLGGVILIAIGSRILIGHIIV